MPVRLFGEHYVAFRAEDGRVGFLDELCPHRRASLPLARIEGNGVRCIYHGWKIDVSGCVVEAPTQVVRPERFAASVRVVHFPVHEAGGLAWVWLGAAEAPPFPDLPFAGDHEATRSGACRGFRATGSRVSRAPSTPPTSVCCTRRGCARPPRSRSTTTSASPSTSRRATRPRPLLTACGRRRCGRPATAAPTCASPSTSCRSSPSCRSVAAHPRDGSMFVFSPVDDTHHLLFYGYFADTPVRPPQELGGAAPNFVPDPADFAGLRGDRADRWGQDRDLMDEGHSTGFGSTLLEEDVVVQTSMGPILDRTQENLSLQRRRRGPRPADAARRVALRRRRRVATRKRR